MYYILISHYSCLLMNSQSAHHTASSFSSNRSLAQRIREVQGVKLIPASVHLLLHLSFCELPVFCKQPHNLETERAQESWCCFRYLSSVNLFEYLGIYYLFI